MYSLLIIHTCHLVSFTLNPRASPYSLALQGAKCVVAGVLLFGVVPLLLGLLCDLIVFTPLRVPLDRTPVYFLSTVRTACHETCLQCLFQTAVLAWTCVCVCLLPFQDWALGLLHTKCVCGAVWLGNSPLKQNLDRVRSFMLGTKL